jgi:hypothetical protein
MAATTYNEHTMPYDAMVFIEGTSVVAIDREGDKIASGTAGTDDTTVIQAAATSITRGTLFIKNSATSYVIASTISVPGYVFIQSDGAKIDVTGCNDEVFSFNVAGTHLNVDGLKTGIEGITATGTITNTATKLIWLSNVARGGVIKDIQTKNVYNVITIVFETYDCFIHNVTSWNAGDWITIQSGTVGYPANGIQIIGCEMSNSAFPTVAGTSYGIRILKDGTDATGTWAPEGIKITNCWIEEVTTCIYSEGRRPVITACTLYPGGDDTGSAIDINYVGIPQITGNYIRCPGSGYGIKNSVVEGVVYVTGNNIYGDGHGSTGIYTSQLAYASIIGNSFTALDTAISGAWKQTRIQGNTFWGHDVTTSTAINLTGGSTPVITGNTFETWLNAVIGSPTNAVISDNIFKNTASAPMTITLGTYAILHDNNGFITPTVGEYSVVHDNYGYVRAAEINERISTMLEILGSPKLLCPCAEITGTSITDYTRNANTLTASESVATWYGYKNNSIYYNFNGTTMYLSRADDPDFTFGNGTNDSAFSIAVALSPDAATSNTVIGKWSEAAGAELREWRFFFDANKYPNIQLYDESANTYIGRLYNSAIATSTWRVFVITYDGSSTSAGCKIYMNGAQVDNTDFASGVYVAMEDTASLLYVGAKLGAAAVDGFFDGRMSWMCVTAKELSADEVWSITKKIQGVLGI